MDPFALVEDGGSQRQWAIFEYSHDPAPDIRGVSLGSVFYLGALRREQRVMARMVTRLALDFHPIYFSIGILCE
jgi:hypothetical protein